MPDKNVISIINNNKCIILKEDAETVAKTKILQTSKET